MGLAWLCPVISLSGLASCLALSIHLQDNALNSIENSMYRTAFKLRSVQTLCQLDLIDSSLIQQVLLHRSFWEASESSLSVQQLFQALQDLFRRARVEIPGQVHPRASELTLSLLMAMYDSTATGFLQRLPVAAALIALSGDSPRTKYRALFQLYAENNRGGYDSGACMTRKVLRNLLTDLQQIPNVVGESRTLCPVESAVRSCFRGVLSPGIKEEKFLSWAQAEPLILLWIPTCHRLSATEMATHPARCSVCRSFPITGLRYRCLKCLNFDICQVCFLSGLHSKSHQKSHPVIEHCVQQMSARENTKLLFRTLRSNLLQGDYGRRAAQRRQRLLDHANPEARAQQAPARLSIEYNSSKTPPYARPSGQMEAAAPEASRPERQRPAQAGQAEGSSTQAQTIVNLKDELRRARESINTLRRERRVLKKQLNRFKDKLQVMHTSQEEKSYRFEAKIQELTTNQESLWTKLRQMRRDLQAILQPLSPSLCCQNMMSKVDHSSADRSWNRENSSHVKNVTKDGPERDLLPNSARIGRSQAHAENARPKSESPGTISYSTGAQRYKSKMTKETLSSLPSCQEELLQDDPQISPAEISSSALATVEKKETGNIKERKDELEEEELQELLSKLMDAFNVEMPSGPQSAVNTDLFGGAERVFEAFSALVDRIILPDLK